MFKAEDKPMDLKVRTPMDDDDFDNLWDQDKVTSWLNENGWPHIANVFEDQNICGERFFHITLAELVQLLPRRITTYADRRRLLSDIRALGVACNQMKTGSTDISINTNLQSYPAAFNSSDNQSPSLPSVGTPTSGHLPTSNSPATPSSASRATDYCDYSEIAATPATAPATTTGIDHTHPQNQYQRSQYRCHSRHGSDLSSSSTNHHHYFYYNNNASSPSTSEFPASSVSASASKYSPNSNNKQHQQSPTKPSYSPKSAFAKFRNSFLSRANINTNDHHSSVPATTPSINNYCTNNSSTSHRHRRRHLSPINTNLSDTFSQQQLSSSCTTQVSPPLISPRISSMNYDSNLLQHKQQKSNRDDQQPQPQPSIPTRISATPDKVSKFWATYSHFHGAGASNNACETVVASSSATTLASSIYHQDQISNTNPSRYKHPHHQHHIQEQPQSLTNNNNNVALGVVSAHAAASNSPQKKTDQRIQITGDKETWYSLNVKHIQRVDQLKDHILKRMNWSGDHDEYQYFHENGNDPGMPLNDQALMYLCSIADHSASDRILVTRFSSVPSQSGGSIYRLSAYAMSTPELGHSPVDTSTSPCTHKTPPIFPEGSDLFTAPALKLSSTRAAHRPRPLCRHTASATRLKEDAAPHVIGIQLSDPPPPSSSSGTLHIHHQSPLSSSTAPPLMSLPLGYHHKPPATSADAITTTMAGLWAIPPKINQSRDCTSSSLTTTSSSHPANTYDVIHQATSHYANSAMTNVAHTEPYLPATETAPSPSISCLSSANSPPRLGYGNNSDTSASPATMASDNYDGDDQFWGERPPAEVVCQNMDKYFDDHDLDKEVVVASTESALDATPQHSTSAAAHDHSPPYDLLSAQRSSAVAPGLRRHAKSIRLVAREASKKYSSRQRRHNPLDDPASTTTDAPTSAHPSSLSSTKKTSVKGSGTTIMRRKSTKLWGQRVVEVKPKGRSNQHHAKEQQISMSHHQQQDDHNNSMTSNGGNGGGDVQWIRGKLIGKGSFGRVYLAFNVVSGEVIAVKQVEIPRTKSDRLDVHQNDMVAALYREIAMLRDLDHETIVQYLGYGVDEQEAVVNIFLEYVAGGNIASRLAVQGAFDEPLIRHFTRQVCQGLAYLHSRHILHRDIKAANILVEADGVCKISDFGLSKKNDYAEVYDQNSRMSLRGSVYWMAPEVVKNEPYSAKVDIWSLGCTVIEMFTGQRPWMTFNQIATLYNLGHHNAPDMPEHASDVAKDFLQKCFTIDPNNRPTALELLDHPFCALNPAFQFKDYVDKGKV